MISFSIGPSAARRLPWATFLFCLLTLGGTLSGVARHRQALDYEHEKLSSILRTAADGLSRALEGFNIEERMKALRAAAEKKAPKGHEARLDEKKAILILTEEVAGVRERLADWDRRTRESVADFKDSFAKSNPFVYVGYNQDRGGLGPYVVAAFFHGSLLSAAILIFLLYLFGSHVEALLPPGVFLAVYPLLAGLAGFLDAWLHPTQTPVVGAAGAVAGLLGIFLPLSFLFETEVAFARGGGGFTEGRFTLPGYLAAVGGGVLLFLYRLIGVETGSGYRGPGLDSGLLCLAVAAIPSASVLLLRRRRPRVETGKVAEAARPRPAEEAPSVQEEQEAIADRLLAAMQPKTERTPRPSRGPLAAPPEPASVPGQPQGEAVPSRAEEPREVRFLVREALAKVPEGDLTAAERARLSGDPDEAKEAIKNAVGAILKRGDHRLAGELFALLMQAFPKTAFLFPAEEQFRLAESLEKLGFHVEAAQAYRRFYDQYPTHPSSMSALVQHAMITFFRLNDGEGGLDGLRLFYRRLGRYGLPDSADTQAIRALLRGERNLARAVVRAGRLQQHGPELLGNKMVICRILLERKMWIEAAGYLEEMRGEAQFKDDLRFKEMLALCYQSVKEFDLAENVWQEVIQTPDQSPERWWQAELSIFRLRVAAGNAGSALALLEKLHAQDPALGGELRLDKWRQMVSGVAADAADPALRARAEELAARIGAAPSAPESSET